MVRGTRLEVRGEVNKGMKVGGTVFMLSGHLSSMPPQNLCAVPVAQGVFTSSFHMSGSFTSFML